jgi:hypothetical protein
MVCKGVSQCCFEWFRKITFSKTHGEYVQKTRADKIFKRPQILHLTVHTKHWLIHKFGINFPPFGAL